MPRLKLTIAYVGTQYHGWQTQARKNASPLPTIQNIIEDAVAHVLGERVHVHGAGRTDAGVHAEAQVAHLDVPESRARMDWQLALNTLLPRDIRIADAVLVPDTFHAQHSAVRKTYEYRLCCGAHPPPFKPLNLRKAGGAIGKPGKPLPVTTPAPKVSTPKPPATEIEVPQLKRAAAPRDDAPREAIELDINIKLDELGDLFEYWKRRRAAGYTPMAIRAALVSVIGEIAGHTAPVI